MSLSRVFQDPLREVWTETSAAAFDGGTTVRVDTDFSSIERRKLKPVGKLLLSSVTGTPQVSVTHEANNEGFLVIILENTAAAGNKAAFNLDLRLVEVQDGNTSPSITVANAPAAPAAETRRLYVDGTLGDDACNGLSWAQAWKTLAKAQSEIEGILAPNPGNLRLDLYVRGAFANEDLVLAGALAGSTTVNVIHHVDDWTVVATGTLTTVAATSLACGLREMTFTGFTIDSTYEGRWIFIEDGAGQRWPAQILRVSVATAWISATTVPAWVVGGDVLTVSVREPSVSGILCVEYTYKKSRRALSGLANPANILLGLACDNIQLPGAQQVALCVKLAGANTYSSARGATAIHTYVGPINISAARAAEFGLIGTNLSDTQWVVGSWAPSATYAFVMQYAHSVILSGRFVKSPTASNTEPLTCALGWFPNLESMDQDVLIYNSFVSGQIVSNHGGVFMVSTTSFVDLPAAGLPSGLCYVKKGGWLQLASTVDGNNTGSGITLYGCKVEKGGKLQMDTCPTALTGDDGDWYIEDGEAEFSVALTIAGRAGGGPDIYAGPNSRVHFGGNVTKSATNPSGGGTANSVIQVRRGAKITQAAGSSFTLPAGSGNNATDYGANGAIDIETGCTVALGTPAGGNAAATGTAVRVKKGSTLAHTGAAPTWGAAALDLGGAAAGQAMPSADTSDLGAATPQNCWVLPNAG